MGGSVKEAAHRRLMTGQVASPHSSSSAFFSSHSPHNDMPFYGIVSTFVECCNGP
jgi:hypothetical protein